ncbi:MAG TPA: amidohydrolase family protein [Acidimicrobiales bacterium]|nr:amidohydrolase family protein [Acidimicrobiales bacterium]
MELAERAFDCDNHYYEALDAFTRHVAPAHHGRCVQWAEINGRQYHVVGGRVNHAVINPTFDPVAMPGAMHDYFRGNPDRKPPTEFLREREPIRPEYRDRGARLARMDEFGLDAVWLFPTLGMLYEEVLKHDPEAVTITFQGFNRWVEEDWGFAHQSRIFAAPYLSLADVDWACAELEWALGRGARIVVMRAAATWTASGPLPPTHPSFDPFWARVNEAGITVIVHAGDSGYSSNGYAEDGFGTGGSAAGWAPSVKAFAIERAAYDYLITLVFGRLFDRFPNLRIASVENGSGYLEDLFHKLRSTSGKTPGYFKEDPVETFRRHIWMNPFWEDDPHETVEQMGADRVIFGSDWPHIEGMPRPLDYVVELKGFDDNTQRKILRENTTALTKPQPA